MRFKLVIFFICSLTYVGCKESAKQEPQQEVLTAPKVEKTEPKSTFEDLEGNAVALSDYHGKRVLLNFWATWCTPCIEEMPALLNAQKVLKNENYVFLLASDQSVEKIKAFQQRKNFDFKYVKFNGMMSDFEINALPATFIYTTAGKQMKRVDGATEWDSPEMIAQLKAIK